MAIVSLINEVVKWTENTICPQIKLKVPDDLHADQSYNEHYKEVTPSAWPLYVPSKDRTAPKTGAPIPSICIQLVSGTDDLVKAAGNIKLRFALSAWNPGIHGLDKYNPTPQVSNNLMQSPIYTRWTSEEAKDSFALSSSGWMDVWNFLDIARREIENSVRIAGYSLDINEPVTYGPFIEEDDIPDYYPFWFAWISFTLKENLSRSRDGINKFL
jgi:hypothetical protein